jgi:hypothetical protein
MAWNPIAPSAWSPLPLVPLYGMGFSLLLLLLLLRLPLVHQHFVHEVQPVQRCTAHLADRTEMLQSTVLHQWCRALRADCLSAVRVQPTGSPPDSTVCRLQSME